jgi:hypothetical protein
MDFLLEHLSPQYPETLCLNVSSNTQYISLESCMIRVHIIVKPNESWDVFVSQGVNSHSNPIAWFNCRNNTNRE